MNAKKTDSKSSSEITVENKPIHGTALIKKWVKDKGWAIGIGAVQLTRWFETETDVDKEIRQPSLETVYSLTLGLSELITKSVLNEQENEKN